MGEECLPNITTNTKKLLQSKVINLLTQNTINDFISRDAFPKYINKVARPSRVFSNRFIRNITVYIVLLVSYNNI